MPSGSTYSTREKVIDRMLHSERGASLRELFDACNEVLAKEGCQEVQSLNTITADITHISNSYKDYALHRGEELIEEYKDPLDRRRVLYRYSNPDFSIYNLNLNDGAINELQKAIDLLSRFQYLPVASWVSEMDIRLRNVVFNKSKDSAVIEFDQDPKYAGNRFISPLYDAIVAKQAIEIDFSAYGQKAKTFNFWPYYLKQYHHTWFLIGAYADKGDMGYINLHCVKAIRNSSVPYKKCSFDLQRYINERIGVTHMEGHEKPAKVRFWTSQGVGIELLQTPLHKSQVVLGEADDGYIFEIQVCYNWELLCSLMQYGSNLVVLEPSDIRYRVAHAIGQSLNEYGFQVDPLALEMVVPENREILDSRSQRIQYYDQVAKREVPTLTVTVLPDEYDRILSGEQTELCREVRPLNVEQYIQLDEDGFEREDQDCNAIPIQYQAILLQDGYDKNSRAMMISVQEVSTRMLVDEEGELITYRYNEQDWIAEEVVYTLGGILKNKVKRVKYSGK